MPTDYKTSVLREERKIAAAAKKDAARAKKAAKAAEAALKKVKTGGTVRRTGGTVKGGKVGMYAKFVKANYHHVHGATPQERMVAVAAKWHREGGSVGHKKK